MPAWTSRRRTTHRRLAARAVAATSAVAILISSCGTRLGPEAFTPGGGSGTVPAGVGSDDVGITPSTITLGLVVSRTSPLGAEAFSAPMYGAQAYIAALNAAGGLAGRHVDLVVCDDAASGIGNRRCMTKLIENDHVFAFVGNSIFNYAAASYVDAHGVPDVGGQPISTAYEQYPHLWSIYGSSSPRDGNVGLGGQLFGGTEIYRYFRNELHAKVAGVVAYNQADSIRFADLTAKALALEGYQVIREQLDFSVPGWNAAAIDMRAKGVDIVFDALDAAGNVSLCKAMDGADLHVKAKVVTTQGWTDSVRTDYDASVTCRNELYAVGTTRNYEDTGNPTIAQFRTDMQRAFPDREGRLSMWALEGWASAQWLADAVNACASTITRGCVEGFLERTTAYDGHGIFTPRGFTPRTIAPTVDEGCLFAARWDDGADDGAGGWVSTTPGGDAVCYQVPQVAYSA